MRNSGLILLCAGILAFFYCGSQLSALPPTPEGLSFAESLSHPSARWEVFRYAAGLTALIGLLLAFFPKGR